MSSPAIISADIPSRNGSYYLAQNEFAEIAAMVRRACGINLTSAKYGLITSRLQKRIRALKLTSFSDYIGYLKSKTGASEMEEMISSITTNVTSFNRESHHFDHFRGEVLPKLIDSACRGNSVRLWSAGCSDGREPYTLACAVLDAFPNAGNFDFRILATDIDKYSIEVAKSGEYSDEMFAKLPQETIRRWFVKSGSERKIQDSVRGLVQFNLLNLMASWPMKKKFDVIFCRNVLIYFSSEDQVQLLKNFVRNLKPMSHLYIGHSERVEGPAAAVLKQVAVTTYVHQPIGSQS